ncbi:AAA family ATPase [Curtobacterium sp. MCBD17_040]|uniref:AAA family ATPase n=1 Tax=Curtobacterium sp. MCBD17_040 TaxID=2175674 RepID=UPI000DA7F2F2|nr:AAA family ATPase [Curtobacterium sp. MCBD17_040]WIB65695.1 AAA family ATPase [Curtobacterium sp. MCBD17_040]
MTAMLPVDWDLIDATFTLPFGYIWNGVAEFNPEHDEHAFIVGPPASGKTVIARSIAAAAVVQGFDVLNLTSASLPGVRHPSTAFSTTLKQLIAERRVPGAERVIVLTDASELLTGRNAAANANILASLLGGGAKLGIHLVLFASDPYLTDGADIDAIDDLLPLTRNGLVALLDKPTENVRLEMFGTDGLTVTAPGHLGGGLLQQRNGSVEQFRAWHAELPDFSRFVASYAT